MDHHFAPGKRDRSPGPQHAMDHHFTPAKRERSPGPQHENKITAEERVKTLKCGSFYAENGHLFCRPCGQMVNHLRKSTIDTHCVSQKHIRNASEDAHLPQSSAGSMSGSGASGGSPMSLVAPTTTGGGRGPIPAAGIPASVAMGMGGVGVLPAFAASMRQKAMASSRLRTKVAAGVVGGAAINYTAAMQHHQHQQQQREKTRVWREFARLLTSLNMPVCGGGEAAGIAEFVRRGVMVGGAGLVAIGEHGDAFGLAYVPTLYEELKEEVFDRLRNKQIAIQIDETVDVNDDPVLNILMADITTPSSMAPPPEAVSGGVSSAPTPPLPFFLCTTAYLEENPSSGKIGKLVIECLKEYDVDLDRVLCLHTDNEPYMVKAYRDILSPLLPNCVHITCLEHLTQVIGQALRKPFTDVAFILTEFRELLTNNGGRRGRLLRYLKQKRKEDSQVCAQLPPAVDDENWTVWYKTVKYHSMNAPHYAGFLDEELSLLSGASQPSLQLIRDFFTNKIRANKMVASARFLTACHEPLAALRQSFLSPALSGAAQPQILRSYDLLETLQTFLAGGRSVAAPGTTEASQSAAAATAAAVVAAAGGGEAAVIGGGADPRYAVGAYAGDLDLPATAEKELRVAFAEAFSRASDACTEMLSRDENSGGLGALRVASTVLDPNRVANGLAMGSGAGVVGRGRTKEQWEEALPFLRGASEDDYELYERYALNDTADGRLRVGPDLFWRVRGGELGALGRSALAFVAGGAGVARSRTRSAFAPYRQLAAAAEEAANKAGGQREFSPLNRALLMQLAFLQWNLAAERTDAHDDQLMGLVSAGGPGILPVPGPRPPNVDQQGVFPGRGSVGASGNSDDLNADGSDDLEEKKPFVW